MISGHGPFYEEIQEGQTEAEKLKRFATEQCIPESDILIETNSITIPDNVKSSLNFLEENNILHKRIILINSPFSQRRGWIHFQKYSENIQFFRINSDVSNIFSRDEWYKSETGIRIIINEFIKIKSAELLNTA